MNDKIKAIEPTTAEIQEQHIKATDDWCAGQGHDAHEHRGILLDRLEAAILERNAAIQSAVKAELELSGKTAELGESEKLSDELAIKAGEYANRAIAAELERDELDERRDELLVVIADKDREIEGLSAPYNSKLEAAKATIAAMSELQRYRAFHDNCRIEDRDGMFVLYEDLQASIGSKS